MSNKLSARSLAYAHFMVEVGVKVQPCLEKVLLCGNCSNFGYVFYIALQA